MVKGAPYSCKNLPKFMQNSDCLTMAMLHSIIVNNFSDIEVEFYDETIEIINKEKIEADIVGISAITPAYPRAIKYGKYFRSKGIPVFIGGVHSTLAPVMCMEDFDSVISGLGNETLVELINDFKQGALKKLYKQSPNMSFENFPHPTRYLYRQKNPKAYEVYEVQATYGCSNTCEFCVQPHVCQGYHQRPFTDVIKEIKEIDSEYIEFYDPNLTKDLNYLKKLCAGLAPLNKKWMAPMTITIANNEELLLMLKKAGCERVLVGFESINEDSIESIHKGFNNIEKYKEAVEKFHKYGILVMGSFVLGLDGDTKETEKNTLKFIQEAKIDIPRFTINTPYPGTEYYKRMKAEGRIITDDLSLYDCTHCVIEPKNLTPKQVEKMQKNLWKKSYSLFNVIKRTSYIEFLIERIKLIIMNYILGKIYQKTIFKVKK